MPYQSQTPFPTPSAKKPPAKNDKIKSPLFLTESPNPIEPAETYFREVVSQHLCLLQSLRQGNKDIVVFLSGPFGDLSAIQIPVYSAWGTGSKKIVLEEYMDYVDIKDLDNPKEKIEELAIRCAGAYNALVRNAKTKGGLNHLNGQLTTVHVPKLWEFFKFFFMTSVPDPTSVVNSWVSYKFKFGYTTVEHF